jgi:malate dehydrogenase (oxaloacetate-decarboxylating)
MKYEFFCRKNKIDEFFSYNEIAEITNSTSVLSLGDIGPEDALLAMKAKAIIFQEFGHVDVFPICLDIKDPEEIIKTIK